MLIRYVGSSPLCSDRLYNTGLVWPGPGSVLEVADEAAAAKMAKNHPAVYERAYAGDDWKRKEDEGGSDAIRDTTLADLMLKDAATGAEVPLETAVRETCLAHIAARWPFIETSERQSVEDLRVAITRLHESGA